MKQIIKKKMLIYQKHVFTPKAIKTNWVEKRKCRLREQIIMYVKHVI